MKKVPNTHTTPSMVVFWSYFLDQNKIPRFQHKFFRKLLRAYKNDLDSLSIFLRAIVLRKVEGDICPFLSLAINELQDTEIRFSKFYDEHASSCRVCYRNALDRLLIRNSNLIFQAIRVNEVEQSRVVPEIVSETLMTEPFDKIFLEDIDGAEEEALN